MDNDTFKAAEKANNDIYDDIKAEMQALLDDDFPELLTQINQFAVQQSIQSVFGKDFCVKVQNWKRSLDLLIYIDKQISDKQV